VSEGTGLPSWRTPERLCATPCGGKSSALEWKTMISWTPASAISAARRRRDRTCKLHTGQPVKRRNCTRTRRSGSGTSRAAPATLTSWRRVITSPAVRLRAARPGPHGTGGGVATTLREPFC
jgi:hypothetical protein